MNGTTTDGYYFRDERGRLHGPLTRFQYEAWTLRGAIKPGTKVWRQQMGTTYRIAISRKLRWQKVFSPQALGACTEWLMVATTIFALAFLASLRKLLQEIAKELKGDPFGIAFFFVLLFITIAMSIATMQELSRRLTDEASDIYELEV
uniref:GYF domain-containing protein n=1 Tax=Aureoumbra lagunensis TaxID=44058 RepID=A0A7S3JS59_9STRA